MLRAFAQLLAMRLLSYASVHRRPSRCRPRAAAFLAMATSKTMKQPGVMVGDARPAEMCVPRRAEPQGTC